jgi:hypothetical protein
MTLKFNLNDSVYYGDKEGMVYALYPLNGGHTPFVYKIGWGNGIYEIMGENELLSENEHFINKIRGQFQATIQAYGFKTPIIGASNYGPKCVCGAHAVKDARHSSWYEIKQ